MTFKPIQTVYKELIGTLQKQSIESPELTILFIIQHYFNKEYIKLIGESYKVSKQEWNDLKEMVQKKIENIPLAYILNSAEFNGHKYLIEEGVLIPRPETEELVALSQQCIAWLISNKVTVSVVELGVGSGIISIELSQMFKELDFYGWDISKKAIEVTTKNMKHFNVKNITLFHQDFFENATNIIEKISSTVTIFISNPPYISESDYKNLDPDVKHEPKTALVAKVNGYDYIFAGIDLSTAHNLIFICEIGHQQRTHISIKYKNKKVFFLKDISGHDRLLLYVPDNIYNTFNFKNFIDQIIIS